MKSLIKSLAVSVFSMLVASNVSAHALSIGYENAGVGSVTVWLGTYSHGPSSHHLEGSLNLVGVNGNPYASNTLAFDTLVDTNFGGSKPSGLVDGVTNFFADSTGGLGNNLPLIGYNNFPSWGVIDHWQGVTFSGLTAGDYQFTWMPIANPTQEWSPYAQSMNGIFSLTGEVTGTGPSVSEPATLALLGLGLIGVAAARRKQ